MAEQAPTRYVNVIRYKSVPLLLDGTFTFKCGLEADVNSFVVAYDDFQRLLATADRPGDLEFFFLRDPSKEGVAADITYSNMLMVSWSPLEVGTTTSGRTQTIGAVRWRVRLADYRERFAAPRGGRLTGTGVLNAKSSTSPLSNSELMHRCLDAMGMRGLVTVAAGVNNVPAPTDLKWLGTHAPTQLDELLDRVGAVFVPKRNGTAAIEMIGKGSVPTPPSGRALTTVPLGGQDRRGRVVVFTSFPNAIMERLEVSGPSDDSWQYVAPDPQDNGRWKKLEEISLLEGRPLEMFRDSFKDLAIEYRDVFERTAYKCLRANPEKFGETPILKFSRRWRLDNSLPVVDDIATRVLAKRWVQLEDGQLQNPVGKIETPPVALSYGAILRFDLPLMKFESDKLYPPTREFRRSLVPLDNGDLKVTFSREERDDDTNALLYFVAGYRATASGEPEEVSDAEARAIAANPDRDVVVIDRPDWVTYKQNNEYVNLPWLKNQAKKYAAGLLKGSDQPAELRSAVGFYAVELSGQVAEVQITQNPPRTTSKVNTWWLPGEYYLTQTREKAKAKAAGNAMPSQQQAQGERQIVGATGEVQAEVPLNPPAASLPAASGVPMVFPTEKLDGGWYRGTVSSGVMSATYEPGKQLGAISGSTAPCLILNTLEQDRRTNRLVLNRWYAGASELQPQTDGTRTLAVSVDPDVIKDLRYKAPDDPADPESKGEIQVAFETAPSQTDDSKWHTKIETQPCETGGGA